MERYGIFAPKGKAKFYGVRGWPREKLDSQHEGRQTSNRDCAREPSIVAN